MINGNGSRLDVISKEISGIHGQQFKDTINSKILLLTGVHANFNGGRLNRLIMKINYCKLISGIERLYSIRKLKDK